jgi:leucyl-tRNA synthetase
VQINGKVRDKIEVEAGLSDDAMKEIALASEKVQGWIEGKTPRIVIVVKGRLVNIVV